jgi:hypothetical protein
LFCAGWWVTFFFGYLGTGLRTGLRAQSAGLRTGLRAQSTELRTAVGGGFEVEVSWIGDWVFEFGFFVEDFAVEVVEAHAGCAFGSAVGAGGES